LKWALLRLRHNHIFHVLISTVFMAFYSPFYGRDSVNNIRDTQISTDSFDVVDSILAKQSLQNAGD
jgi:hypothetical protein